VGTHVHLRDNIPAVRLMSDSIEILVKVFMHVDVDWIRRIQSKCFV
jgi:hypothetical protein